MPRVMKKLVLILAVSLTWVLVWAAPAFAQEGDAEKTDAQWLFLLQSPDNENECTFFAKPGTAGYPSGEETQIILTIQAEDKSYDVTLLPVSGSGGWFASDKYDMSGRLISSGYEAEVNIMEGGESAAQTHTDQRGMAAGWPAVRDGSIKLKGDRQTFELKDLVEVSDSALFRYEIESASGCSAVIMSDQVEVTDGEGKAHFNIVVSDPAGNRKVAEIKVNQASISLDPKLLAGVVLIAAAAVLILFLIKKRKSGEIIKVQTLTDAICDVEDEIGKMKKAMSNAESTWRRFEQVRDSLMDKGQNPGSAAISVGAVEDSNAYQNAETVLGDLEQVFNALNYKLPKKETLTQQERDLEVRRYLEASWRSSKLGEAKKVRGMLDKRCGELKKLTEGMLNQVEIKPLQHDIFMQVETANEPGVWEAFIACQDDGEAAKAVELESFPLFSGHERKAFSALLPGPRIKVIGDNDQEYQLIADQPCLTSDRAAAPDSSVRISYGRKQTVIVMAGGKMIGQMTLS